MLGKALITPIERKKQIDSIPFKFFAKNISLLLLKVSLYAI